MALTRQYLLLAAILVGAIVFRTVGVASQGLWFDEGLTVVISRWWSWDMLVAPPDSRPPLYYLLQGTFVPAGVGLLGFRSLSIVCGVISVGLMYVLGRMSFGRVGGLIAAALLAVWTSHVDYSQEARPYSLLFMLTLVGGIGVLTYGQAETRRGRIAGLAMFVAANVLSFYTHVIAVYWIAATSLVVLGTALARRKPLLELVAAFAIMALLTAPPLYRLVQSVLFGVKGDGKGFEWLPQADLAHFGAGVAAVFLPSGLWESPWLPAGRGAVRAVVVLLSLAALGLASWRWAPRLRTSPAFPLIIAYLAIPLAVWGTGFVATPIFMPRIVLCAAPGLVLLIAGLCTMTPWPGVAAAAVVGSYVASTLMLGFMREKEDLRGAAQFVEASAGPQDVIAVCAIGSYPALRFHADRQAGAMVVSADLAGTLVQLEGPLGSSAPGWERRYYVAYRAPGATEVNASRAPEPLPMPAGRAVWRVDAHCKGAAKTAMDAALARFGDSGQRVWRQTTRSGREPVTVRRYVVRSAGALPVLPLARQFHGEPPT